MQKYDILLCQTVDRVHVAPPVQFHVQRRTGV